ncbi:bifunctional 6-phosphofructo-2-kinase fructose--bisphosphate 2-phosphatase [Phaffia rhodozyma]|uniref:fructose-2,6-bisphosphate 2-phosphatase n=1 Tax=Phaffia rhodozyma TaxID=264483 RepID=A0A0F7SV45_PHARH|nr:bifunctional 6-phosphofructo-2-kinase fructose--bisphosphate 2-phosphatase [Phaffia rhodozyma]
MPTTPGSEMPAPLRRSVTPSTQSSLRNAVAQLESLQISSDNQDNYEDTIPESTISSTGNSSTISLTDSAETSSTQGKRPTRGRRETDAEIKEQPFYGATSGLLHDLDRSTLLSRKNSRAPTRAPSVTGIGNLVSKPDYSGAKIVVAMVGLPARGKSFLSNKLKRYLQWLEYKVKVFNVGQMRRRKARDEHPEGAAHSESYFNHADPDAKAVREKLAEECLDSLIDWLKREGNVGIHDATNTTKERRAAIEKRVAREHGIHLLFLESVCEDAEVIAANIALKVSSGDPDYKDMTREAAEADFKQRIANYEKVYEPVDEPHLSYCKVVNVGRTVHINRIGGYLESRVAFYLMNLHLKPRAIFLSRHGESMYNVNGQIGGDADLSERGQKYAKALPSLILENVGDAPLTVWTSTLRRTIQTAQHLPYPKKTWKSLDELDAGVCDGMTYEEIEEKYPDDYANRDDDKFNYRYRGGESYRDVLTRLEPVIMELERQENILIIGHQAIIRSLYAYFQGYSQEELPYIPIPLHTLIKLVPKAYGCDEERYPLPIPAVDTHRPKPQGSKKGSPATTPKVGKPHLAALSGVIDQELKNGAKSVSIPSTPREYFGEEDVLEVKAKDKEGSKLKPKSMTAISRPEKSSPRIPHTASSPASKSVAGLTVNISPATPKEAEPTDNQPMLRSPECF